MARPVHLWSLRSFCCCLLLLLNLAKGFVWRSCSAVGSFSLALDLLAVGTAALSAEARFTGLCFADSGRVAVVCGAVGARSALGLAAGSRALLTGQAFLLVQVDRSIASLH